MWEQDYARGIIWLSLMIKFAKPRYPSAPISTTEISVDTYSWAAVPCAEDPLPMFASISWAGVVDLLPYQV